MTTATTAPLPTRVPARLLRACAGYALLSAFAALFAAVLVSGGSGAADMVAPVLLLGLAAISARLTTRTWAHITDLRARLAALSVVSSALDGLRPHGFTITENYPYITDWSIDFAVIGRTGVGYALDVAHRPFTDVQADVARGHSGHLARSNGARFGALGVLVLTYESGREENPGGVAICSVDRLIAFIRGHERHVNQHGVGNTHLDRIQTTRGDENYG